MSLTIRISGTDRIRTKLARLSADLGREVPSLLKQQARATAVSLCFHTQPYGLGSSPPNKFKATIAGDIRRVFATRENLSAVYELIKPRSEALAKAFYAASKRGDQTRALAIMRQAGVTIESLDRSLHRAARTGKRGAVAKNSTPRTVVRPQSLAAFTREKIATIGTAKAGWFAAGKAIGGRIRTNLTSADGIRSTVETIPAWVRKVARTYQNLGSARVTTTRIEIFTNVEHADEALPQGALESAIQNAQDSFRDSINKSLRALIQKHFKRAA